MEHVRKMQLWRDITGRVLNKEAELAETYDMTSQGPPSKVNSKKQEKFVIPKTAEAVAQQSDGDPDIDAFTREQEKTLEQGVPGTQPETLPQAAVLRPHVDVSGKSAPKQVQEKKAERYAMPSLGMYPIDDYAQVKEAARYFMNTYKFMPPAHRHEFCQNLTKRASALDIYVDPLVEKYGSGTYAPHSDVEVCLDARRKVLNDEKCAGILDKLAELRPVMTPEDFATALSEFDKMAALTEYYGNDVPDAYYTTFGKVAAPDIPQESKTDPTDALLVGNEYLPARKLVEFAKNSAEALTMRFGPEFMTEFQKDPLGIFNSLPRDQKLVIMRMANTCDSQIQGASTA